MSTAKIAISLEPTLLDKIDFFINKHLFPNRSRAIQVAIEEKVDRLEKKQLAMECAKLNKKEERKMADEGLSEDLKLWPEY